MSTLYATDPAERFFLIPDDAELPPGALRLQSLTGRTLDVDPAAAEAFEMNEEDAQTYAGEKVEAFVGQMHRALGGLASILTAAGAAQREADAILSSGGDASPAEPDPLEGQERRIEETLGLGEGGLRGDPAAVLDGIGDFFSGLGAALQAMAEQTPAEPEVVAERVAAVEEIAREEGFLGADEPAEGLPERLESFLRSEELLQAIESATDQLLRATGEE